MGAAIDHAQRATECRRLVTQYTRPEHWGHFLEMAETWEMLLRHQQERSRSQAIALGDRFRKVLFLSKPAETDDNEKGV